MAINKWINGTIDPNATNAPDGADHRHRYVRATSEGGDINISFDTAKVTSQSILRSALNQALRTFSEIT